MASFAWVEVACPAFMYCNLWMGAGFWSPTKISSCKCPIQHVCHRASQILILHEMGCWPLCIKQEKQVMLFAIREHLGWMQHGWLQDLDSSCGSCEITLCFMQVRALILLDFPKWFIYKRGPFTVFWGRAVHNQDRETAWEEIYVR